RALRRGGQPMTSPRGEAYASERCVTYNPRLSFAISSVDPDWENDKLLIGVDVRGGGMQPSLFVGQITDQNGQRIATIPRVAPNSAGNLMIDLPTSFRRAAPDSEYLLTLRLDGISEVIEEERSFRITPPASSNLLIIGISLLAAIGVLIGLSVIRQFKNRSTRPQIPKPADIYNKPTQEFGKPGGPIEPSYPATNRELLVRVTIIRTTAPGQQGQKIEISSRNSPLMIGRSEANHLTIKDPEISNRHAQIAVVGHEVYLTDLGSRHGTYLNGQQLSKNTRVAIVLPATLGLGYNTELQIEARS
ncbi:MAG: FHA domain-containing protein, partial [Oscillochloridaceae bacterium umkhey_bin13]